MPRSKTGSASGDPTPRSDSCCCRPSSRHLNESFAQPAAAPARNSWAIHSICRQPAARSWRKGWEQLMEARNEIERSSLPWLILHSNPFVSLHISCIRPSASPALDWSTGLLHGLLGCLPLSKCLWYVVMLHRLPLRLLARDVGPSSAIRPAVVNTWFSSCALHYVQCHSSSGQSSREQTQTGSDVCKAVKIQRRPSG